MSVWRYGECRVGRAYLLAKIFAIVFKAIFLQKTNRKHPLSLRQTGVLSSVWTFPVRWQGLLCHLYSSEFGCCCHANSAPNTVLHPTRLHFAPARG